MGDNAPRPLLDTRGLRCPLPVLRLEAFLRACPKGQGVTVLADDPIAAVDIPHAARQAGYDCVARRGKTAEECVFEVTICGEAGF